MKEESRPFPLNLEPGTSSSQQDRNLEPWVVSEVGTQSLGNEEEVTYFP